MLRAFENGADGVYVAGCLEGECHFLSGNIQAGKRVQYVKDLLQELGIEPERIEMFNMSAAQASRFVEIAVGMIGRITELGPSQLRGK